MLANSFRPIAKRINLKAEALYLFSHLRHRAQVSYYVNTFIRDDKSQQLFIQHGIFHQRSAGAEVALKRLYRESVQGRLHATPVIELTRNLRNPCFTFAQRLM